jgi:arginase
MNVQTNIQVILVPYEVERQDTGMARAPHELVARGFLDRLRQAGREVHAVEIQVAAASKVETVAGVGQAIARAVALARSNGRFPLILSGGCLASVGVVAGLQKDGIDPAVVWIDAHGDFNTPESSPSGYWDGMALTTLCGSGLPELAREIGLRPLPVSQAVHLAGRDFDPLEQENIRRLGLVAVPPDQMSPDQLSLNQIAEGQPVYLHIDLDGLNPRDAPAVALPVPGGPGLEDVLRCLAALPAPAAMTLSSLSFDRVDAGEAARTIDTCLRLVEICGAGHKRKAAGDSIPGRL